MLRVVSLLICGLAALPAAAQDVRGTVRVIDGDTLEVGGTRVRLHGVDAPELDQRCTDPDGVRWRCGAWVTERLRARIGGRAAACAAVTTDRYDRVVATCRVGGEDVGRRLVAGGLALAYRKYSMAYDLDEKRAVISGRGLHAHSLERPAEYRRAERAERVAPRPAPDPACAIKGNIGWSGKRIYHMPAGTYYDRTRISGGKGERWFCSESQARAAGWRRAHR